MKQSGIVLLLPHGYEGNCLCSIMDCCVCVHVLYGATYMYMYCMERHTCTCTVWSDIHVHVLYGATYMYMYCMERHTCTCTVWSDIHVHVAITVLYLDIVR